MQYMNWNTPYVMMQMEESQIQTELAPILVMNYSVS